MPIIKLQPFCKTALWGGNELKHRFGKQFHHQKLAETWELSCHPNGESIIANGPFAGQTLRTFLMQSDKNLLGENCRDMHDFPLLIKWIDAAQPLSVQVHPNDSVAHENGEKSRYHHISAAKNPRLPRRRFLYPGRNHSRHRRWNFSGGDPTKCRHHISLV